MSKYLVQLTTDRAIVDNGEVAISVPKEYEGRPVEVVVWVEGWIRKEVNEPGTLQHQS